MKPFIICPECYKQSEALGLEMESIDFCDDGVSRNTCSKGHTFITLLQEQRFALLFDFGMYSLTDGRYRDAVFNFATALERFYEFYVQVVFFKIGIDEDTLQNSWKLISRQSERQLGAYIFTYTIEKNKSPKLISSKDAAFRNDVIHNGRIPKNTEAIDFGRKIFEFIRPLFKDLRENYAEYMSRACMLHSKQMHEKRIEMGKDIPFFVSSISTVFSPTVTNPYRQEGTFDTILETYMKE